MTHPTPGGSEAQDSPITYHLEAVVVEEEEVVEEVVAEVAEEVVILEIKMIGVLDKS